MTTASRTFAATTLLLLSLSSAPLAADPDGATATRSPEPAAPAATVTRPGLTATALSPVASASPQILPAAEPRKLVLQAAAPGGAGAPGTARGEGRVAKDRPATFLFQPEAGGLFSISVASPQNTARLTVYLGESTQPEAGTSPTDGAIRWSTGLDSGVRVKIVVHTAGEEIPFGVEVISGPGSV